MSFKYRIKIEFLASALLCCWATAPLAETKISALEKRDLSAKIRSYYPSVREVYEGCKEDIEKHANDPKSFLRSYCGARMSGFFEGFIGGSLVTLSQLSGEQQWDLIEKERSGKSPQVFCLPLESFPQNAPLELSLAKDFTRFIETKFEKGSDVYSTNSSEAQIFTEFLTQFYKCPTSNKKTAP